MPRSPTVSGGATIAGSVAQLPDSTVSVLTSSATTTSTVAVPSATPRIAAMVPNLSRRRFRAQSSRTSGSKRRRKRRRRLTTPAPSYAEGLEALVDRRRRDLCADELGVVAEGAVSHEHDAIGPRRVLWAVGDEEHRALGLPRDLG